MIKAVLKIYSAIFRFGGLAMAIMSGLVSTWIGFGIARDGYILVEGRPAHDVSAIATAVCTPLIGVAVGLALFFLVPKVRAPDSKEKSGTQT
jgi:hypothetical protein